MLDTELAKLYGVAVKALNQAVKRNSERFPVDFMFQLSGEEAAALRSQIVTLDDASTQPRGRGRYAKYLPYAFTEQGVAMLSSVRKSTQAVQVNVEIMRAFVRLRGMVSHSVGLQTGRWNRVRQRFKVIFDAIRSSWRHHGLRRSAASDSFSGVAAGIVRLADKTRPVHLRGQGAFSCALPYAPAKQ